jgi:hypothetical protein
MIIHPLKKISELQRILLYIILTVTSIVILLSCEEPKDFFSDNNSNPEIYIKSESGGYISEISADLKLSNNNHYKCTFKYIDDQEYADTIINLIEGKGKWKIEDSIFYYFPESSGNHSIELTFSDPYKATTSCKINLNVFWNLKPVAVLRCSVNENVLNIDASQSYDQDEKFGGKITAYRFILDDYPFILTKPVFLQYTDNKFIRNVKLQVRDNNDEWSDIVSQNVEDIQN